MCAEVLQEGPAAGKGSGRTWSTPQSPSEELESGVLPQKAGGNKGKALPPRGSGIERGCSQENSADSSLLRTPSGWKFHSPAAGGFVSRGKQESAGTKLNIQSHEEMNHLTVQMTKWKKKNPNPSKICIETKARNYFQEFLRLDTKNNLEFLKCR